jgi:hypothetical protein
MAIADLTQLEILQGSTSLLYAIVGTIIGAIIASKYYTYKRSELLGIGLSLIFATVPWYAAGISFLTFVFFGFILADPLYFFISYGFTAIALICFMFGITKLLWPMTAKKIVAIISIIYIVYEIVIIFLLITDIQLVAVKQGKFISNQATFSTVFGGFTALVTLITMLMFIRQSFMSDSLKIKWKGRFLLIAVLLLIIGSMMENLWINLADIGIILNPSVIILMLVIARIILITRLIFSYLGWLLPPSVEKWLIKDE